MCQMILTCVNIIDISMKKSSIVYNRQRKTFSLIVNERSIVDYQFETIRDRILEAKLYSSI